MSARRVDLYTEIITQVYFQCVNELPVRVSAIGSETDVII